MDADGHTEARGHVAVLLKNVPACRALVTELKQLKWHDERDDESGRAQSFCSFTLHAELRGSQVWVVGTRVSGGAERTKVNTRRLAVALAAGLMSRSVTNIRSLRPQPCTTI